MYFDDFLFLKFFSFLFDLHQTPSSHQCAMAHRLKIAGRVLMIIIQNSGVAVSRKSYDVRLEELRIWAAP
jgi:hypothetical protein